MRLMMIFAAWNAKLPATDECYYVRDNDKSEVSSLTTDQTELLRRKLDIVVKGDTTPPPILSFASCKLPRKLLENIEVAGYEMPTPVQMQAIPAALARQSLLVSAETGSGKTGSFLIPIVSQCAKFNEEHFQSQQQPLAMVLTPTRELCIQVEDQAKVLGKGLPFKTALVVGGDAMAGQLHRIQKGVSLIVGTPGRLIDLLTKHEIELDTISILVLDEVDCMLQRGFREQVIVFDMPNSIKEYVHQVGRASRMGEEGTSIVFVNEEDKKLFPELVEALKSSGAAIPRELANSRYSVGSFSAGRGQKKRKHGF
ncbi:DEAD-box ATP-dependent RNA helicase 41 [Capsicum baccatum]|uniref:DEAD-box ATP-dependent RNA helicase 41 n=1 Tax=Capsicum baccatum TaxID=33114 RepID=A0A2G2UVK0_CAPBA|nr:DEAD-box ATP-dependent RNA helicase 41 [Capsicum baccatum]